jgi:hypothetical protein
MLNDEIETKKIQKEFNRKKEEEKDGIYKKRKENEKKSNLAG